MERVVRLYQLGVTLQCVPSVVFLNHAGRQENGELLAEMVRQAAPKDVQVYVTPLFPFIGAHTGPNMFSICLWGKAR